jgi:hypothetical protein
VANGRALHTSTFRWGAVAVLVAAGIGVGTLVASAYGHATPIPHAREPAPIPTFSLGVQSPAPTPSPTTSAAQQPRDGERFLAVGTGAGSNIWWRAVAGTCGGTPPLVERSTDAGAMWSDVTPLYLGAAQLTSLDSFNQTEAQLVVGVGPSCEPQALRTFTQGQFWESNPDALAASRFVDLRDPATVQLSSSPTAAPCADARGMRAQGVVVALICDSTAYVATGGEWMALPNPDAAAIAVAAEGVMVAHAAPDCPGLSLSRYVTTDLNQPALSRCAEGVEATEPIAITTTPSGTLVWSGESLTTVAGP